MAEPAFESELEALFEAAPPAPDSGDFALIVERRLDSLVRTRRLVYGLCGVAGAAIAGLQISSWIGRGAATPRLEGLRQVSEQAAAQVQSAQSYDFSNPTFTWTALVLACVAAYVTRLFIQEQ